MSKPEACPFCGGPAKKEKQHLDERFSYADQVCYGCAACGFRLCVIGNHSKGGYADNSKVEEQALARWNTRASTK